MAWHLRCAYKTSPQATLGYIGSGWTDNAYLAVVDKNDALALQYPLYLWNDQPYLRAPGSSQDWYGGDDSSSYARWVYWNSAKAVNWDKDGMSSTISLGGAGGKKLSKPDADKKWLKWLDEGQSTLLLTWEEW